MRTLLVAAGVHSLDPGVGAARLPGQAVGGRTSGRLLDPGVGGAGARAVLLDGDRVAWTGADPAAAPPADRTVDLGSAWITPAFVDAHVHGTATGLAIDAVDLDGATSLAEALARLRAAAAHSADPVVRGLRWDDTTWPEGRPPTAAELAEAAPGRTVLLLRVDAHSCVVDPGTLGRLPLARLEGVHRDARGAPTGWLVEEASQAAQRLVGASLGEDRRVAARHAACAQAAALGIGTLHEMGHPGLSSLDDARAWATGSWPVEVLVWWAELDAEAGPAAGLRPGGDLFLDGSIGSHTAAVTGGYADAGGRGVLFHPDEAVAAFFTACTGAGRGAGVHAIGDAAVEQAVAAVEAAAAVHGPDAVRACRHRVEHAEVLRPDHPGRMARLGVVASVQPAFDAAWGGPDGLYARRLGPSAALAANPFATLDTAGVPLAFGSDSTVTPLDPWGAVAAAERHHGGLGVPRLRALRAHTLGGRHAAGQADVGPLRPGLRADLAAWDADPLQVPDVRSLACLATVVRGVAVHGAPW